MKNAIVLLIIVVIVLVAWFVVPYYIALLNKDVKKIRTSATFASFIKAEQEIEKKTNQSVGNSSEDANNATGEN